MCSTENDSSESQLFLLSEYTLISEPSSKELLMIKKSSDSDSISGVRFHLTSFVKVQWQADPKGVRISIEDPPSDETRIISSPFPLRVSTNSFLFNEEDGSLHLAGIGISDLITGSGEEILERLIGFARREEKTHLNIPLGKKELKDCASFEIPEFYLKWDPGTNSSPFWDLKFRLILDQTPNNNRT